MAFFHISGEIYNIQLYPKSPFLCSIPICEFFDKRSGKAERISITIAATY